MTICGKISSTFPHFRHCEKGIQQRQMAGIFRDIQPDGCVDQQLESHFLSDAAKPMQSH
jgi:hypothetical protein